MGFTDNAAKGVVSRQEIRLDWLCQRLQNGVIDPQIVPEFEQIDVKLQDVQTRSRLLQQIPLDVFRKRYLEVFRDITSLQKESDLLNRLIVIILFYLKLYVQIIGISNTTIKIRVINCQEHKNLD